MLLAALRHTSRGAEHGLRFLFPLLLIGLLTFLAVWLIRRWRDDGSAGRTPPTTGPAPGWSPPPGGGQSGESPIDTLQQRFARGEIDQAEYEHRRAVLIGAPVVPPADGSVATEAGPITGADPTTETESPTRSESPMRSESPTESDPPGGGGA